MQEIRLGDKVDDGAGVLSALVRALSRPGFLVQGRGIGEEGWDSNSGGGGGGGGSRSVVVVQHGEYGFGGKINEKKN